MAKILIVDDNATNRKLAMALLSNDGHVTFEACDGVDGMEVARAERPQLVISDILMPSMDGYEFVRQLRGDTELRDTPVMFYTAHYHEREAHNLAESCGVARVLVKPCPAAELLQAVEQVLAGVSESDEDTLIGSFDREHLLLVTNKLAEKADALGAANARLAALASVSIEMAAEYDPHALLQRVCDCARGLFGSRFAVVAVTKRAGSREVLHSVSGIESAGLSAPASVSAGRLGAVLTERRAWRASSAEGRSVDAALPRGYPTPGALVAVPLVTPTHAYGWLCLGDKIGAEEFDSEDQELLCALGAQFARLYENASARLAGEQHVSRVYALLGGMTASIMGAFGRNELCWAACRLAVEKGGFRLARLGRVESATGKVIPIASAGDDADLAHFAELLPEVGGQDGLVAAAVRSGRPGICNDLELADTRVRCREELLECGYGAVAVLPLMNDGVTMGYLILGAAEPGRFDAAEMRLLTELTVCISLALRGFATGEREH